ncbi:quinone oxidoreductase [Hwanghaeella grinnelliae]|uniref:Quinone oxidoreductase n=1 Tax=Hwanghaeella grinnelliae TaxID=2500179 RepID=A0A3S2ZC41_9PROT|nr:quinone oxidoreductase [Hwanghaeella grinnelliae]RVU39163.1 quinone oxidoreductase [Hwanghaeella grinnelliae]
MDIQIQFTKPGGPDCLTVAPHEPQPPGPGEIRLRHAAIGVNFVDIYHRTGLYPLPLPAVPGVEGSGIVEAIGDGVDTLSVGDTVSYAGLPGAYAATRLLPAWRAIPLPADIDLKPAAVTMLRGLTAHMLMTTTYPVDANTILLVHSAAGGLGMTLTRWAKRLGAVVIGTVSSPEKARIASQNGADHLIVGRDADLPGEVSNLTDGLGVHYAIDGIGGDMLQKTMRCVRPYGMVASIGQVAGPIPALDIDEIGPARNLSLSRHSVVAYAADPRRYSAAASAVLATLSADGIPAIGGEFRLAEASKAHLKLEDGETSGSLILLP